jgi:hypothetical protein
MEGKVVEATSRLAEGEVLRHFVVVKLRDLRYDTMDTYVTIPLNEANGACVGDAVELSIVPKGKQKVS